MVKEKHKTFYPCCCFCCCPSHPMHVTGRIPVSGYTPGQTIDVEIDVNNRSDEYGEFSVQLLKQINYYTYANSGKTRLETVMICEKGNIGVSRTNTSDSWRAQLVIPPIPPSDETTSNICKVHYILRVSCCTELKQETKCALSKLN